MVGIFLLRFNPFTIHVDKVENIVFIRIKFFITFLLDKKRYDLPALVRLMTTLSSFAISVQHLISEIDLNPVILHSPGNGISVVDALMVKFDETNKR